MSELTQTVTISKDEYELLIRAKQVVYATANLSTSTLDQYEANAVIEPARDLKNAFLAVGK